MRSDRLLSRYLSLLLAGVLLVWPLLGCCVAADLDQRNGPPAVAPPIAGARPCRLVPMPETNLEGYDVERFRPTWVCVSRGLYADTLPPPPPLRRPWWWW